MFSFVKDQEWVEEEKGQGEFFLFFLVETIE